MPAGELVIVPDPVRVTVSVRLSEVNVAVTVLAPLMVTLQVLPRLESQPLQLVNVEFPSGVAVRVTAVPLLYAKEHVAPQLIPLGELLTVPPPVPFLLTVRVCCTAVNVAVTDLAAFIATVH